MPPLPARPAAGPALTLVSQTPWITPAQPWFNLALGIGAAAGPASGLHVSLTFYARLDDSSQLQQAIGGSPPTTALLRLSDLPVGEVGPTGALTSSACVTVLPDADASPRPTGPGACPAGSPTLTLDCTPLTGRCGDVYPVAVALLRQGSAAPLARFITFLTYQEPGAIGEGGPLRVGVVVPVTAGSAPALADALSAHRDVATTLSVSPVAVAAVERTHSRDELHAHERAGRAERCRGARPVLRADQRGGALGGRHRRRDRRPGGPGDAILRDAGFKVTAGPWVDTVSSFAQGDAVDLASGLQVAGSSQLVLNDNDLAGGGLSNYTFAQPFTLDLGHGSTVPAAAADSALSARFTAQPADPVLGAQQLLAALDFVHFENAFLSDARGVVVDPPAGWQPSGAFLGTLLAGLSGNPALSAVTLSQLFTQVPVGGNREPAVRQLQAGPADPGISHSAADRIALGRQQLSSYTAAANLALVSLHTDVHPPELTTLNDTLLATEARGLERGAAHRGPVRLRQGLRRPDQPDHPCHRTHRDLHRAARRHPRHRALECALPDERRRHLGE